MGQISTTTEIPAPPEKVWEAIATPATYEKWMTVHTKWKDEVPGRFSPGATAAEVVTMLGMPNTITWTVEEFEEPSLLRISGTGMAGVRVAFVFEVAPDGNGGSNASAAAEFEGQMIVGALGKAVEKDGLKNLEESLDKLSAFVAA
jgi:carbon monoxide dehydrogenase subunit G